MSKLNINGFKYLTENEICEFGHFGLSKGITEHLSHLKEHHQCIVSVNKKTKEMDYIILDKDNNIVRDNKNAETLLCWIDGLLLIKYGSAKPWINGYDIIK